MKPFVLALLLALLLALPAVAKLDSVSVVDLNGSSYQLTALVHSWTGEAEKPTKLHKSEVYREYSLLEPPGATLVLNEARYKVYKKSLKALPDERPYSERHPLRYKHQQFTERWKPVSAFWFEIILSGASVAKLLM